MEFPFTKLRNTCRDVRKMGLRGRKCIREECFGLEQGIQTSSLAYTEHGECEREQWETQLDR